MTNTGDVAQIRFAYVDKRADSLSKNILLVELAYLYTYPQMRDEIHGNRSGFKIPEADELEKVDLRSDVEWEGDEYVTEITPECLREKQKKERKFEKKIGELQRRLGRRFELRRHEVIESDFVEMNVDPKETIVGAARIFFDKKDLVDHILNVTSHHDDRSGSDSTDSECVDTTMMMVNGEHEAGTSSGSSYKYSRYQKYYYMSDMFYHHMAQEFSLLSEVQRHPADPWNNLLRSYDDEPEKRRNFPFPVHPEVDLTEIANQLYESGRT